ncbi:MAG TPA: O-antigen ligase family protein [Gallicola sp.]|nr:O-antigen ligase family protein [Gallicola sp.]
MRNFNNKPSFKDVFVVSLLILPIMSRWLLPSSIETPLTKSIQNIPFYLPNILIFIFLLFALKNNRNIHLKLVFWIHFLFFTIGVLVNEYTDKLAFIFSGTYYFYAIFIALHYRLSSNQKIILKRFLFISLLLLFIQVVLYSTGILEYSLDITSGYEIGGVYRISTTVGAATGTAGLIFLIGCLVFYLYGKTFSGYSALIITALSLLLLISRGAIAAFGLFSLLYFWNDIRKSFKKFFITVFLLGVIITSIYKIGLFDPLLTRIEAQTYENNLYSGRDVLIESTLSTVDKSSSYLFGVGTGNIYPSKDVKILNIKSKYPGAPHNSFVLIFAEQGIFGLLLFGIFWSVLLFTIKKNKTLFYTLLSFVVVLFNTETVFIVDSEYVFLLSIAIMMALDKSPNIQKSNIKPSKIIINKY